jgi:hypothetical protein
MHLNNLLPQLKTYDAILVTGPQRSGTTIASHILAHELGYKHVDENDINIDDIEKAKNVVGLRPVVLQAPGLCFAAHTLGFTVVIMRRSVKDIQVSEKRIRWPMEQYELKKYGLEKGVISEVKYNNWDQNQKQHCVSFDLDYDSLSSHQFWIDPEQRKKFRDRQWTR